ncbi:MAG TPA: ATP-binding protein [Terriglobales bacterium]|nr:ATP-binding protein [Terriglobales bacterium]
MSYSDVLHRIVVGDLGVRDGVPALVDRATGRFSVDEGRLLDYKLVLNPEQTSSIAEVARDILAFSNTDGGLLLIGVTDQDHAVINHQPIDFRRLRALLGPYIGTRVNFDLEECPVSALGRDNRLIVATVRRSQAAYPNQLRKDIELRPGLVRKLKYLRGTLFYRDEAETLSDHHMEILNLVLETWVFPVPLPVPEVGSCFKKTSLDFAFMRL